MPDSRRGHGTMRICVLGTHSFRNLGPKVGIQHIAQTLARMGHDVLYVTVQASPIAITSSAHRARLQAAFEAIQVEAGLREVTPLNLLPARVVKQLEKLPGGALFDRINASVDRVPDRIFERETFDVCICCAAGTLSLVDRVRAARLYYRLNDLLSGFRAIPRALLRREDALLQSERLDAVWAVNVQLMEWARQRVRSASVSVEPNGVVARLFESAVGDPVLLPDRDRNVIYVGAVEFWVDVELLVSTARLMPDHAFHIYGPWATPVPADLPANMHVYGPIAHDQVATKMKACAVGIIPASAGNHGRMVEKPLKYYEYLAAGLGVAATSSAGRSLEPFAVIGDTPEELARAIVAAREVSTRYQLEIQGVVAERDWKVLVRHMLPDA